MPQSRRTFSERKEPAEPDDEFQKHGDHVHKWGDTGSLPEMPLAGMESGPETMHKRQYVFLPQAG
jgi:hypothetical protein